jgi:hypothetical protein
VANGRKRKNTMLSLKDNDLVIEGTDNLLEHATTYYKSLFGPAPGNIFEFNHDMWESHEKINDVDNEILSKPFTMEEVKDALFSMKKNKAPGPDNIPIEFYQHCWDIVKGDIMNLFYAFHEGSLDVQRLNYGIITLLPKISDAEKITQYRPICLLRCIYKLLTKVLTIRVEPFLQKIISTHQNAFIKNRNIVDGIMSLHELMHHTHIKKHVGIILKLDFEKAFDKVNWEFLLDCQKAMGFGDFWCNRVKQILHNGTISVKINNVMGPYFQSAKGVRQGDPLSPFLFNSAVQCLTKMVLEAQANGLLTGLAPDLIDKGVAIMQYADDTVICISHDLEKALNLKLLLYIFELMSGLKINFQKSELFLIGGDNTIADHYSSMFGCQIGTLPMNYLGVPVSFRNLKNSDLVFIDEKFVKKLDAWKSASSSGGRLVLVNACLSSLPSYIMSLFLLNKTFIEKLDKHRRRFLWHGKKEKKGYYMVKWSRVCRSKNKGGLGVKDLRKQNISLLCKWWWKLETQDGLWQTIVKAKYLRRKTITNVTPKFNDSPCWKALIKVKDTYLAGRKISLGQGNICRLWKDTYMDDVPLCDLYPVLFDLCQMQDCTVQQCVDSNYVIPFRRRLHGSLLETWNRITSKLENLPLSSTPDRISWKLNRNGIFSTKSVYKFLELPLAGSHNKWIWRTKIPLKIKIFMWQLCRNALPTRENLRKRNWMGSPLCSFCNQVETCDHLFFACNTSKVVWGVLGSTMGASCAPTNFWQAMAWFHRFNPGFERFFMTLIAATCWAIWTVRNKVTFDDHVLRSPSEITFSSIALLIYWAGLLKAEDKSRLTMGAQKMMTAASSIYASRPSSAAPGQLLMITEA